MYRVEVVRMNDYARAKARSKIDLDHAIRNALNKLGEHTGYRTQKVGPDIYHLTPLRWVGPGLDYSCGNLCVLRVIEEDVATGEPVHDYDQWWYFCESCGQEIGTEYLSHDTGKTSWVGSQYWVKKPESGKCPFCGGPVQVYP